MKILIISPEAGERKDKNPLGKVINSTAKALTDLGHDVLVFSPFYSLQLDDFSTYESVYSSKDILHSREFDILQCKKFKTHLYLRYCEYFERDGVYNYLNEPYADNHLRFSLLGLASLQYCIDNDWIPDKIICNEWASSLACSYAKGLYADVFGKIPLQLTIHNLKYDFHMFDNDIDAVGLDSADYHINGYEFWGKISLLKAGIFYADQVVLTSVGYLNAVLDTSQFLAGGIQGFLQENEKKLKAIQNGIDYNFWNFTYFDEYKKSKSDLVTLKKLLKKEICKELNFKYFDNIPLVYCHIDRDSGKLARTLSTIMSNLLSQEMYFIIAIDDNHSEKKYFDMIVNQNKERVSLVSVDLTVNLRKYLASSDMIFTVALEEPSAVLLLKAMVMGCIPVTSRYNGSENYLNSYTIPMDDDAVAFVSQGEEPDRMLRSLREANSTFKDNPNEWKIMLDNNLKYHRTWENVVKEYISGI